MDASYESDSGFNLPPGCTDAAIDRHFGERGPTCAECRHMVECCCDYGVCGLEFDRAFAEDGEGGRGAGVRRRVGARVDTEPHEGHAGGGVRHVLWLMPLAALAVVLTVLVRMARG